MSRLVIPTFVLCCFTLLAGCGDSSSENSTAGPDSEAAPKSRGKIGVSLLTFENPFFKVIAENIERQAAKYQYEVIALSADNDATKQASQVDDFIVQKVTAIVLSPRETRSIVPAIQRANKAGIPVFTVDIPVEEPGVQIVCQIATDNRGGGKLAAQAMIEAIGSGKVAILDMAATQSCRLRVQGFREVIDAHNENSEHPLEIVAELECEGKKERGRSAAADALQSHPDLRGIFAINDPAALGAVAAVEEAGKAGQVIIIGFDGQPEGKLAIDEGKIYADPIQFPDLMGQKVVDAIVSHLKGENVAPEILIPTSLYKKSDQPES